MVGCCCPRLRPRCRRAGKTVPLRGPRAADKRAHGQRCVHRRRCSATNSRRRALGHLAPSEFVGTPSHLGKQSAGAHVIAPAANRPPAGSGGRAYDREWTCLAPDLGGALLLQTEERQGLRDGRCRVPAPRQHCPWHDQHYRIADQTEIPSTRNFYRNCLTQRLLRSKHLPHAQPVPMQPQSLS